MLEKEREKQTLMDPLKSGCEGVLKVLEVTIFWTGQLSRHLQRMDSSVAPRLQLSWKAVLVVIIYRTLSPRHKNHMYKPDIKCFKKKIADFAQNKVLKSFACSGN